MADYIDRNILSQAYIHIDPVKLDDADVERVKHHLEAFIATRGQFFLYEAVSTDVEFKEGSLKVYATIAGALYIAIGQYGSFRDGLTYLAQDTKRLAECVISEGLFLSRSRHDNTIRAEARTGVVGSLKSIMDRMQVIRSEMPEVTLETSIKRIGEVQASIEKVMGNLNDPQDPPFVADGLCGLALELFPATPPRDPKKPPHREEMVALYKERRAELIKYLKEKKSG